MLGLLISYITTLLEVLKRMAHYSQSLPDTFSPTFSLVLNTQSSILGDWDTLSLVYSKNPFQTLNLKTLSKP
jgi:hypothetical protein